MRQMVELVNAVGIPAKKYTVLDLLILAGRVIKDPEVHRRVCGKRAGGTALEVIRGMNETERAAVRERCLR